jgi:bifunctional UDP-N-acetylglucosamine pyrophosphorylase/glucosamine-1-phosphate N-acetyltransferase
MGHITALILAAGEGKRMKSDKAKAIHEICGKAMIEWVYEAARGADIDKCVAIVGHKAEQVKECMGNRVEYVLQEQHHGTGHAVQQARSYFSGSDGLIVILCADVPLISSDTIKKAIEYMNNKRFKALVITAEVLDPYGYGRIVRDSDGNFERIVEQRDATENEKAIREINSGMYVFSSKELEMALGLLTNDNAQKEYYLTDTLEILLSKGYSVGVYKVEDSNEILGVNDRIQLEHISDIIRNRKQ